MPPLLCNNPARDRHEIVDGDRKVTISLGLTWGQRDLRDDWRGDYAFCSFGCLGEWAAERAAEHDHHVLVEGARPKGDAR